MPRVLPAEPGAQDQTLSGGDRPCRLAAHQRKILNPLGLVVKQTSFSPPPATSLLFFISATRGSFPWLIGTQTIHYRLVTPR